MNKSFFMAGSLQRPGEEVASPGTDYTKLIAANGWSVPSFDIVHIRPKMARYCLVVPVINEGERIRRQLLETMTTGAADAADVIIADGGSTDGSLDMDFLKKCNVRSILRKTGPGKLSAQLRCGYAVALLDGYEGIVTIDGNGKDSVVSVLSFVRALSEGYDYVQASRFLPGGAHERTPWTRMIAIRLIHSPLLSLAARRYFSDTTQGFRAYSSRYLLDPRVAPFRDLFQRYELLAYLTVRASQLGYRTGQVPTRRIYPEDGAVPTKITSAAAHLDLVKVLIDVGMGRFNPPAADQAVHEQA